MKNWQKQALELLEKSLTILPHELNQLEWKLTLSPNHERLINHLSALANYSGGGFLVFGIDDKTMRPVGIAVEESKKILSTLSNLARGRFEPEISLDSFSTAYEGCNLLIIYIYESLTKPVYNKLGTIEDAYIRSGGTTRKASRSELAGLMLNSNGPRWEELHATTLLAETDVYRLLDYYAICRLLKRPSAVNNEEVLNWLESEKMIKKSADGGYHITNLGGIAAARDLNDFPGLSRKSIRVIKYKGTSKVVAERELVERKGYALGFEGLIEFLNGLLPQSEIIGKAFREEKIIYPEIALRELIANLMVHQDFTISGCSSMIEIFDDRIEFTSPGGLLSSKTIDRLIGTAPQSRNEILAQSFRRYSICEERGTGFIKSISAIELFGLPPLKFIEDEGWFKVILYAPRKFAEMSPDERVQACYQHACVRYLSNSYMTNTSLRERFRMPEKQRPMVSKLMRLALEAKIIKVKDVANKSNKFAEYLPYWA